MEKGKETRFISPKLSGEALLAYIKGMEGVLYVLGLDDSKPVLTFSTWRQLDTYISKIISDKNYYNDLAFKGLMMWPDKDEAIASGVNYVIQSESDKDCYYMLAPLKT